MFGCDLENKKRKLSDILVVDHMPLIFDCDSAFWRRFEEFYWFKSNPLPSDSLKTLQSIFDMEIRKTVNDLISDIKQTAHNEEKSTNITQINEKTKYGIKMSLISAHCKIAHFLDFNVGNCISSINSSMWFAVRVKFNQVVWKNLHIKRLLILRMLIELKLPLLFFDFGLAFVCFLLVTASVCACIHFTFDLLFLLFVSFCIFKMFIIISSFKLKVF